MVPPRKKKYESGEGAIYWTRAKAMRKLQLSLKDFRRLCILKGIYPREPKSRKKAQKGEGGIKTMYHKKDIQFLLHEPIIWKFREAKVHGRKIGRAKAMKDFGLMKKLQRAHPQIQLDHIIKERYPTFIDALRDLDDCLTLCFLFGTFPSLYNVPRDQNDLCRRLTLEFMHAVIVSKALRKVFISIKGYYFQAEIKGQSITWIVPHHFSFTPQSKEDVDFKIMSTFVQMYIVLLGFVNFKLFHELNLHYPPSFSTRTVPDEDKPLIDREAFTAERVAALNIPLCPTISNQATDEDSVKLDTFNLSSDPALAEDIQKEAEKVEKLKDLFKGLKVFLNREVPREPLTFVLRCFGAEVSWDKDLFIGATFSETDETITHHIIDRPVLTTQYISRYYVQPQWVFDSVNARELLPVEKYFVGCLLPPHLSPFTDSRIGVRYEPPEELGVEGDEGSLLPQLLDKPEKVSSSHDEAAEEDNSSNDEETEKEHGDTSDSDDESVPDLVEMDKKEEMKKKMAVKKGKIQVEDPVEKKKDAYQEFKLREKMVPNKHRALYKSMMKGRRERNYDIKVLKKKRAVLDKKKNESVNQNVNTVIVK